MLRTAMAVQFCAIACLSTAAMAQDIQPPSWLERPDAATFAEFYPNAALHQGVAGVVRLECLAELDNTASCVVMSESPANWGFGDAAMMISRSFRFAPATRDGRPVRGGRVNVPVRFNVAPPDWAGDEYNELLARVPRRSPVIRLPMWEEAPNFDAARRAYPRAWDEHVPTRVLLSCLLNADRRLVDCEAVEAIVPGDPGADEAALALAGGFRVSERETAFLADYVGRRVLLPLYFGGSAADTPVDRFLDGFGANTLPPPPTEMLRDVYPPQALAEGRGGEAIVRCTPARMLRCTVIYEAPDGAGFGDAGVRFATTHLAGAGASALPREVYIPFLFRPD